MALISVVIPLYNKADSIGATLRTVLAQTFTDFEVVVVDDGSTDGSADAVLSVTDQRVRLVQQPNGGVSAARNRGIAEARGTYIAFLDADDEWLPGYLAKQADMIKRYPDCAVFVSNYAYKDELGRLKPTVINEVSFQESHGILNNYFVVASKSDPPMWTSAIVVEKQSLEKIGMFPIGIATGEDLLVWARLAVNYKIVFNKEMDALYFTPTTGTYRIDPKDMSLKNDIVRMHLHQLLYESKPKGWNLYLSFWDKMRAVINMRKGLRVETLQYAIRSLYHNPINFKAAALVILAFCPKSITNKVLR